MNIYEKLSAIQNEMRVPKNRKNNSMDYTYRNCEDIEVAAKPVCQKYKTVFTVSDEIVMIGERYYVKATASLFDFESEGVVRVTASAREMIAKKGLDDAQLTGATSSYARKYALSGLFALNDEKDADSDEGEQKAAPKPAGEQKAAPKPAGAPKEVVPPINGKTLYGFGCRDVEATKTWIENNAGKPIALLDDEERKAVWTLLKEKKRKKNEGQAYEGV